MPMPDKNTLDQNLLVFIAECGGVIRSEQSYQPLANLFSLNGIQRSQKMEKDHRPKWENDVQWSRERLADDEYIERPEEIGSKKFYHGFWRLSERGLKEADRLAKSFPEPWLARMKAVAEPIKRENEDL